MDGGGDADLDGAATAGASAGAAATGDDGEGDDDNDDGSERVGGCGGGAQEADPALGAPAEMLAVRDELTPMMAQYTDLCETYDGALVLFQVGDFYEAFCHAAETVARVCEVTLTKREDSTGRYPMAGVPIDNAASYVERLLDAGYRVALADQVQPAEEATGLVDRAVTQLVTPGTLVDDELLAGSTATYLGAVARGEGGTREAGTGSDTSAAARPTYGFAVVDVSTGECLVTSGDRATVVEELERLGPAELLTGPGVDLASDVATGAMRTSFDPDAFGLETARETVSAYARPEAVLDGDAEVRAAGAALAYAEYTQGGDHLEYVSRVTRFDPREYMRLDATALRSLEVFESRSGSGRTLMGALDDTACALGRRRLEAWLRRPSVDREEIETRLDAVEALTEEGVARETLRERLREVYDLERLVGRVSRERANARDLRSLATTLAVVPAVEEAVEEVVDAHDTARLAALGERIDDCADVRSLVEEAIVPDPPQEITEGGVVREGFDAELDDLRATEREGREWVSELEARERERTGIDSLDVGYTQVHGYYIEVTNPNLDRVPDDYTRRQTLKNSERFYTPELKRREDEILSASERANSLEYEVFREVRASVAEETERVQELADALAELDVLTTFAAGAVASDYSRPTFGADAIRVEAGRHPVVERTTEFVPNGIDFSEGEIALVTGPNMSGKSTYMRQVALTCVMAQAGSFVPAARARLRVVDRVFTRVGASDDIAGGQSTFMREMAELTEVLHAATEESLVLLDEVGRGTATTDGLAIARATTEFLHDEVGATTLFATHYHELTDLATEYEGVFTLHFTADRDGDDVTFLHRVADGPSSSSYGVEVARLAGVPDRVVERARALVEADEGENAEDADGTTGANEAESGTESPPRESAAASVTTGRPAATADPPDEAATNGHRRESTAVRAEEATENATDGAAVPSEGATDPAEKAFSEPRQGGDGRAKSVPLPDPSAGTSDDPNHAREVLADIRAVDVARTTPMDALALLHELQRRLDDANQET